MAPNPRARKQQLLREAEGYLELISLGDGLAPKKALRDRIAERALDIVRQLPADSGYRVHALFVEGQALRILERYEEAVGSFLNATQIDRENVRLWLAIGWCYKRMGRLGQAIQALEEALSVDPDSAIVYYNLACYWSLAKNARLAVEYLGRAFDLNPRYRELVAGESDFDPVRQHPGFLALTTVIV